jgi:hypothetical protein
VRAHDEAIVVAVRCKVGDLVQAGATLVDLRIE